ncbi:unnamed protein product [Dimorphilus gyrociliatus]|uniref:B box-type domain-containing protein n=1 Tax=Dimorphilus gyrociliatus TaxID=2664684 RepID=A0A7I8VX83_9ANNE|nr:unnamed protein product [Dimorphilus gyrociliatus]
MSDDSLYITTAEIHYNSPNEGEEESNDNKSDKNLNLVSEINFEPPPHLSQNFASSLKEEETLRENDDEKPNKEACSSTEIEKDEENDHSLRGMVGEKFSMTFDGLSENRQSQRLPRSNSVPVFSRIPSLKFVRKKRWSLRTNESEEGAVSQDSPVVDEELDERVDRNDREKSKQSTNGDNLNKGKLGKISLLASCVFCKGSLHAAKVFACLHFACSICTVGNKTHNCPICTDLIEPMEKSSFADGLSQLGRLTNISSQLCDNCEEGKQAKQRCSNCYHFLCDDCTEAHRVTKQTKTHIVVKAFELNEESIRMGHLRRPVECLKHSGEHLRFYCDTCAICVCADCRLNRHLSHRCEPIKSKADYLRKSLGHLQNIIISNVDNVQDGLNRIREEKLLLNNSHLASRLAIRNRCEILCKSINLECDKLLVKCDSLADLELNCLTEFEEKLTSFSDKLIYIEDLNDILIKFGRDTDVIENKRLVNERLSYLLSIEDVRFSPPKKRLEFKQSHFDPVTFLEDTIGQIESNVVEDKHDLIPSNADYKANNFLKRPKLEWSLESDTNISGLTVSSDLQLVIVDASRGRLISISIETGETLKFTPPPVDPWDVCAISSGYLVTDKAKNVVLVYDRDRKLIKTLHGFTCPLGLAVLNNDSFIVTDDKQVCVIRNDKCSRLKTVFNWPVYVATSPGNKFIIVSDNSKGSVTVIDDKGGRFWEYTDRNLSPSGIACDKFGNILIADRTRNLVLLLSADGTNCRILLTPNEVNQPRAVTVDSFGHVFVGEATGGVKIFRYVEE